MAGKLLKQVSLQIDEPAIREGLPLRRAGWKACLEGATRAFRLSASGVADQSQIHTHMCYAEFNDKTATAVPPANLWINPDCGLKTRGWPETEAALANMVAATKRLRSERAGV